MTLPLTPHALAAAYEYLRTTPPFKGWKLPEADAIVFKVARDSPCHGFHQRHTKYLSQGSEHCIGVSETSVGHTDTLFRVLGHEMIHMWQSITRAQTAGTVHNAEFRRIARLVCKTHGWDAKHFFF